jgi:NADPH-dependent F420 reductase
MPDSAPLTLAFLGGTGAEGAALALRYARAGHPVAIGSRSLERAQEACDAINKQLGLGERMATPYTNRDAVLAASVVFLTIPYSGIQDTLGPLADEIGDRIVISTIVPMTFESRRPSLLPVAAGSAAQEVQQVLPTARVISAFHHVSAKHLEEVEHPLEGDVLVCGNDAQAKSQVLGLVAELAYLRPLDAGTLDVSYSLEALTPVLAGLNRRYRAQSGVRIIGLDGGQ